MLDFFLDGDLPGEEPGLIYPRKDVANLKDVWLAAQILGFGCAEARYMLGWAQIGEHSIYFFKWCDFSVEVPYCTSWKKTADCPWLILSRPERKHRLASMEARV